MSTRIIRLSIELHKMFQEYRKRRPADVHDQTQLAILNVVQAFRGIITEERILQSVENAKSPNAVSRALRRRLSIK